MPILREGEFEVITASPQQTVAVGERLGALLSAGDVVCLQGGLGAGKTCLTQGIGRGLHVVGRIVSPTFVFINEYGPEGAGPYLYHVDLYRLDDAILVCDLGLDDYIYGDGVTVVEWADRAEECLPKDCLWIRIEDLGSIRRCLILSPRGEHYEGIVDELKRQISPERASLSGGTP